MVGWEFGKDFISKIYDKTKEKNVAIVNYLLRGENELNDMVASGYADGVLYGMSVDSAETARKILETM